MQIDTRGENVKIAVCDAEKKIVEQLEKHIRAICPDAVVCSFASAEELFAYKKTVDILFLDIQMQGVNGMEAAKELRRRGQVNVLIFVTALETYVFQAFDVKAFHYLVKPVDWEKFRKVLQQAMLQCRTDRNQEKEPDYIIVQQQGMHTKVVLDEIIYAEVFNRKVVLHKMDGDIEYYGKLSELAQRTGDSFFRTHRAYLVNLKYVETYHATEIFLKKGKALMAKGNYREFVKSYMRYNRKKGAGRL